MIFEIIVELHYNLKNPKSQFSHENIEQIIVSLKKHTPPNAAIAHLLVYSRPILANFSGQKWNFNIFVFSPL